MSLYQTGLFRRVDCDPQETDQAYQVLEPFAIVQTAHAETSFRDRDRPFLGTGMDSSSPYRFGVDAPEW